MGNVKKIGKSFWDIISRPEMGILPGQIAFFHLPSRATDPWGRYQ